MANKLNKSLVELSHTPVQQLHLHSLLSWSSRSSNQADVSALTESTPVKSLGVDSPTAYTAPLEDNLSCDDSLDFC